MKSLKTISEKSSMELHDYVEHLKILLNTQDEIMQQACIYPAIQYIQDAIKATMEAIRDQVIHDSGLDETIKKIFSNSTTNHMWDWNKEFQEWRKQKGGIVNFKRKE